jgi:hypothetical protein
MVKLTTHLQLVPRSRKRGGSIQGQPYESLHSTKYKTYDCDFVVNSAELSDDSNEDMCASGKKYLFQRPTILRRCLLLKMA